MTRDVILSRSIKQVSRLDKPSLSTLISIAKRTSVDHLTLPQLHDSYFEWAKRSEVNRNQGIYGTPKDIAKFMVKETRNKFSQAYEPRWLDPCCGSGIFIEAIFDDQKLRSPINPWPQITAFELNPIGMLHTILVLKKLVGGQSALSNILSSGKLILVLDDFLSYFPEISDLYSDQVRLSDLIICNPPYIRSSRLSKSQKIKLKKNFPLSYDGGSDLSNYFLVASQNAGAPNSIITFIVSSGILKNKASRKTRGYLKNKLVPLMLLDLDETTVFEGVQIPSIILQSQIKNAESGKVFQFAHLKNKEELHQVLNEKFEFHERPIALFSEKSWKSETSKIEKIDNTNNNLVTIKHAGIEVHSGVRPDISKAFIWNEKDLESLPKNIRKNWFVRCLKARDISKWSVKNQDNFLLKKPDSADTLPIELQRLLEPYELDLKRKNAGKNKKWYELRSCGYYDSFSHKRIVFPDISSKPKFAIEIGEHVNLDGTYSLMTSNMAILGILNSDIAWEYFVSNAASIGNPLNKGRIRLKKNLLEGFPIPREILDPNNPVTKSLTTMVDSILFNKERSKLSDIRNYEKLVGVAYKL